MIINKPWLTTDIDIWAPRYKDWSHDKKELVVLIPDYKIQNATPVFRMHFTRAKHLRGLRYCMQRTDALRCPIEQVKSKSGIQVPMRVIPLSMFGAWESGAEARDLALNIFEDA
jgi:hypothetical protein